VQAQAHLIRWVIAGVVAFAAGLGGGIALAGGDDGGIGQEPTLPQPVGGSTVAIHRFSSDVAAPALRVAHHHAKKTTTTQTTATQTTATSSAPIPTATAAAPVVTAVPSEPTSSPVHHTVTTVIH
jgi:hypothetical protein